MAQIKALCEKDFLERLPDEHVQTIMPDIMRVLSQSYMPDLPAVLSLMKRRENLFFPYISDILHSKDANSKYWVMSQLIPSFSFEHKQALKSVLEEICYVPSCRDEDMALSDCAEECLENCFGI